MKVLFILEAAFNPRGGGVQHTTYKLGKYFTEQGLDVYYFSFSKKGHIKSEYGTLFNVFKSGRSDNPDNVRDLAKTVVNVKPDIVINQHPYVSEIRNTLYELKERCHFKLLGCLRNSLFSFKDNLPFIVSEMLTGWRLKLVHNWLGLKIVEAYHYLKHRRDLKQILVKHDYFILLAPTNRQDLEYFVGKYKSGKVKAIPNSIPEVFDYKPEEKEKIILYVGRLNKKQKRADLLVPIWEEIYKKLPEWKFIIVGDGSYKKTVQNSIEERKLPRIETHGRQNPDSYYRRASILVMPSAFEGFPNVLLEAQSHSVVPVLFNSYSSVSWVVENGKDAFLAKPFHVKEITNKVEYLANNLVKLKEMASAANANARRFTTEKVGNIWLDFFKELV